jgi:hypothetical protein
MNIPGFTAESSLYKTSEFYYHSTTEGSHASGSVYAAFGLEDVIESGSLPFVGRQPICWLPYKGVCIGSKKDYPYIYAYECTKYQYIC